MKVCFVTNIYPPESAGGPGEVVFNLQKFLMEQGIEAYVFTCGISDQRYPKTIRTYGGKRLFPLVSPFYFNKIKEKRFDITNIQSESGMGIAPLMLLGRTSKVITTLHSEVLTESFSTKKVEIADLDVENLNKDELISKYLLALIKVTGIYMDLAISERIIAVSEKTKQDFLRQNRIPEGKISVIHNGVDSQKFNPRISGETIRESFNLRDSLVILTVGGNILLKGTIFALYALRKVVQTISGVRLIIIGVNSKNRERLSLIIKKLDLENNVNVVGQVLNEEMPFYYSACDVVLLPSLSENFPVTALEAMSSAKPIIASRVGGVPEIVSNNSNGIFVAPGNVEQIVQALLRLLENPSIRRNMGEMGRKTIEERFDWKIIGKEYLKVFESVL